MAGDVLKYSPCSEISDVHWEICVTICNLLLSLSIPTCLPHRAACHLVIHAHIDLFFSKETTRLSLTWKHLHNIFCPIERTFFQLFLHSLTSLVSSLSLLSLLTLIYLWTLQWLNTARKTLLQKIPCFSPVLLQCLAPISPFQRL